MARDANIRMITFLQVNEFHHAPVDFIFTSPLNDSVLPPLRVSGDGVLKEFGFVPGRAWLDAATVWLLVACFGALTYFFLETAGRTGQQSLWGISMAWAKSVKKTRSVSGGLEPDSPLAGVNQELAGIRLGWLRFSFYVMSLMLGLANQIHCVKDLRAAYDQTNPSTVSDGL